MESFNIHCYCFDVLELTQHNIHCVVLTGIRGIFRLVYATQLIKNALFLMRHNFIDEVSDYELIKRF